MVQYDLNKSNLSFQQIDKEYSNEEEQKDYVS